MNAAGKPSLDSTDARVRELVLEGVAEAYGSGPVRKPGISYHLTHCGLCGRPVAADRVCPVHGAPKDES